MKRIIAVGRILRGGRVEMVTAHDAATAAMDADLAEVAETMLEAGQLERSARIWGS